MLTIEVKRKAKNIQNMFNQISPRYDFLDSLLSFRRDVSWRKKCIRLLDIADNSRILDLACGTGEMIRLIKNSINKKHFNCDIVGADFSLGMLNQAQKKVSAPLVAADACAMPFPDNYFDYLTISFGFRNITDKETALKEMFRVLKPGGKVCILEFSKPKLKLFRLLYWLYFDKILPYVGSKISHHKSAYSYLPSSVKGFLPEKEYKAMITEAGFKIVKYNYFDLGICSSVIAEK